MKARLLLISILIVSLLASWKIYNYFFDNSMPSLSFEGIEENGYYVGDINCKIRSSKSADVSLWLDGKPLMNKFHISSSAAGHSFTIPSKTLSNGQHQLKMELTDNTYHKNKVAADCAFMVDNAPLQAALIRVDDDYKVFQGRTLHLQFQVNKPIKQAEATVLSQAYECFPESKNSLIYECFIPMTCEEKPNEYLFTIDLRDHVGNSIKLENKFQVVMYPFKKQNLNIANEVIKTEDAAGQETKLEDVIAQLTKNSIQEKLWKGSFCTPIDVVRVTCDFGTLRTTQHKGRYAHKALDVFNQPKSVVWASQDGVVVFKDRFAAEGNTVIIDHGKGILSAFCHLDSFSKINLGEKVAKGNPLGTIGKTGHATGYHLHWAMFVNTIPVDPIQWTKPIF